jgi:di/tricarboxylate transporter
MSIEAWMTLLILVAMLAVLASDKLPAWLVFLGTLTLMMTLRLAPQQALIKGFSNVGVLAVAALFPVAAGMYSTGAVSILSQRFIGQPKNELAANLRILPPIAIASSFLNNTPVVAMMIPVVRDLKRQAGLAASSLFMGLSFAAALGGNTTLIGGAVNLVIAGLVVDAITSGKLHGMQPVTIFELAWVGVPAAIAGLLYLIFIAPRLMPGEKGPATASHGHRRYLSEFKVQVASSLSGATLEETGFLSPMGLELLSIRRGESRVAIEPSLKLSAGDVLVFSASSDALPRLWTTIGLEPLNGSLMKSARYQHQLVEVVISTDSPVMGSQNSALQLSGNPYEAMLVGISRDGQIPAESLADFHVEAGDTAIIEVDNSFFQQGQGEKDFALVKRVEGYAVKRVDRAVTATIIMVAMIAAAASGLLTVLNSALLAALTMLLTGCLDAEQAWASLQWKTLVVLGGALGLESAITGTGLSAAIAKLCDELGGNSPYLALAVVYVITTLVTNVISNVATAAFMFPVALSMSQMLGVSFKPFAMIIMVAASSAFINPAGTQTNLMVQDDGGYTFMDFAKVGFPLTVIVGVVVVLLAPIVYGL